ncbi:MAG TPA: hypothetical protein DCZ12_09755, partial [Gammaproteobacteria bacterium]|nr:hypothetical protein [Gammaproteobacteria bacterium]
LGFISLQRVLNVRRHAMRHHLGFQQPAPPDVISGDSKASPPYSHSDEFSGKDKKKPQKHSKMIRFTSK